MQTRKAALGCVAMFVVVAVLFTVDFAPSPQTNDYNNKPVETSCFPNICGTSAKRNVQQGGPVQDAFEKIYSTWAWSEAGGGSGPGSEPVATINTRTILELVIYKYQIKTMVDAPCGAIKWTRIFLHKIFQKIPCFKYHGVDVVRPVINNLTQEFKDVPNMAFSVADLSGPGVVIPQGDLILCRDALQHIPLKNVIGVLENFSRCAKCKYLIVGSYPGAGKNQNIEIGKLFFFIPVIFPIFFLM